MNCLTSVWRTLLPVTILMLTAACATSPTGRMQLMLVSPEAAIVESQKAYLATMDQLAREDRLSSDRAVATRVGEITGRIVTIAEERFPGSRSWAWSVAIIDDPETVNAWCMAGGRMAVYTGLLQQLNLTDDELAHIMGHEVAHALANHTAEQMSRALATNIGLAVVDATVDPSQLGLSGAALAAQLALQLPNSRTAESEADQIGTELAIRAGYDPDAVLTLWQKMADLSDSRQPEFVSTHPSPDNRQERLAELIDELRPLNPTGAKARVAEVDIIANVR